MMIPIPNVDQIQNLDLYTIKNDPITSVGLMERASVIFSNWFEKRFPDREINIYIFCGTGNNGGDGLAVSRLLSNKKYKLKTFLFGRPEKCSKDCEINLKRLYDQNQNIIFIDPDSEFLPPLEIGSIVIDALLGSGLDRSLKGGLEDLIIHINEHDVKRISIDIPSGLFVDRSTEGTSFQADYVLSFEFPKLAFLMPDNETRLTSWDFKSIALLLPENIASQISNFWITTLAVKNLLKKTAKFSHKGTHGTAFLIVGQIGFSGAAVLASSACLKAGCGLLIAHLPKACMNIVQQSIPEAICQLNSGKKFLTSSVEIPPKTKVVGIGPGIGTKEETAEVVHQLLSLCDLPMVIDADALNIIAANNLFHLIPKESILSPHPGEFRRLFGHSKNDFEELEVQRKKSIELNVYIVFKGAYSRISTPEGKVYFNSSGNPGMAKAGSGDVLTGILTGLLARGYSSFEAAIIGVHLHGVAADIALDQESEESLLAVDIIKNMGRAYQKIRMTAEGGQEDNQNMLEPPL